MSGTSSSGGGSRWCPTPEQVMMLEALYRGGLKTPTASQIQHITARLSLYGQIQGKNVFYWFQNHKARDRQKLRKKLMAMYQHHLYPPRNDHHPFLLHPQVGGVEDATSCKRMVNKWKMDLPLDQQTCTMKCDCPLMNMQFLMMDHMAAAAPYNCTSTRVPPKTLELFPITTTSLKDEQSTISKP